MKNKILPFILILGVTSSAWSQQSCPLTNAKLIDLRTAASKLAKTIIMSPECQQYQNTINQANAEIKKIAIQIKNAEEIPATPAEKPDLKNLALEAVTHLDSINSVFRNQKCGEELAGFLDYADAFVDVATGLSPFLALNGGAEAGPWVLGSALGGAAAKAVISFFRNKDVDMKKPDQSNAFIKNSCAFYNLNMIKNSLDEVELNQTPRVELELTDAKIKFQDMIKSPMQKPSNPLIRELTLSEKDQLRLKSLGDQMRSDATEGCSYLVAYVTEADKTQQDGSMLERVWRNYEENSEAGFKLDLEKRYFQQDLNAAIQADNTKCSALGIKWLNKMVAFNEVGLTALKKVAEEDSLLKGYRAWLSEKDKQEILVKSLEAKMKFFRELTGPGFSIEKSEITRSHEQVQNAIFKSFKHLRLFKANGLAEAWLKEKHRASKEDADEFDIRKEEVEERIKKISNIIGIQKPEDLTRDIVNGFTSGFRTQNNHEHIVVSKNVLTDVCTQLRMTWTAWYDGLIHARAGKEYCVAFDNVINQLDYPEVQTLCFATVDRRGEPMKSLRNQVTHMQSIKVDSDRIVRYMDNFGCRRATDAATELLALPIQ